MMSGNTRSRTGNEARASHHNDAVQLASAFELPHLQSLCKMAEGFAASLSNPDNLAASQTLLQPALKQADAVGIKRADIADRCQLSEATISRWQSGQVTPHPLMARTALEELRLLGLERVSELQKIIRNLKQLRGNAVRV